MKEEYQLLLKGLMLWRSRRTLCILEFQWIEDEIAYIGVLLFVVWRRKTKSPGVRATNIFLHLLCGW